MTTPDTTEAIAKAVTDLQEHFHLIDVEDPTTIANAVIEADRKSLAEQGYVIAKKEDQRALVWYRSELMPRFARDCDMKEGIALHGSFIPVKRATK